MKPLSPRTNRPAALALLLLGLNVLTACSGGNWVKDVAVTTSKQGADHLAHVTTTLNTGDVTLDGLSLPIIHASKLIGTVTVVPSLGGIASLIVNVDVDQLVKIPASGPGTNTLPNGAAIPVVNSSFQSFPIGSGGSEFYASVASDRSSATIGVSLIVPSLQTGTPAFAYAPFNFADSISGEAGLFTGAALRQSGFALFANINLAPLTGSTGHSRAAFAPANTTSPDYVRIQRLALDLNDKKAHLRMQ